jgi:dsDNA-binding SOS-regulon protein
MQRNSKNIDLASILKWEDKVVQLWFKHSKNELLSENERELYFWLATNRNSIHRTYKYGLRFY